MLVSSARHLTHGALLVAASAFLVGRAHAQSTAPRPIEVGVDGGIAHGISTGTTVLTLPGQQLRVGFFRSDVVSIEPALALNYGRGRRFNSLAVRGELGVLYHLAPDRTARQPYLRPFVGLDFSRFETKDGPGGQATDGSSGNVEFGAGVGVKLPVTSRLTVRVEGSYSRSGLSGWGVLGLSTGISFYAR
jgi:hypothetical protein